MNAVDCTLTVHGQHKIGEAGDVHIEPSLVKNIARLAGRKQGESEGTLPTAELHG
jgi:hypothetical protein